jgi:aspartyl-tRNA(Asn)/glutamyl-tRNA(Gln) amidotransferase subunit A
MVAAGIVPYAIGTDGGGSIRIPAALTGIFGVKANFGRVPVHPVSATPTLAHVGPLSRTVADAALVLETLAGYDARDPFSIAERVPSFSTFKTPERPLRIAYSPTLGYAKPTKAVLELADAAAGALEGLGHRVELVDHVLDDPLDLWRAEFYAGAGTRLNAIVQSAPELIDPAVLTMLRPALSQNMMDYYAKVFERYALRERLRLFFEDYDLLVSPTLPCTAFAVGQNAPEYWPDDDPIGWVAYTYPFNLTGQPAASICAGFSADG